ncbi:hypothetical protein C4E15_29295 [Achromobacter spanius]|uniref:Uncharacterized protein n=1 Tax=Achromobacter spanius TaxID=217203 RepID=A0A2S5GI25_9BURK|nr:hypothetical protein [Achromobacter spanius]PPA72639.1 hypothetical protein C4E15_29295 [Achromobacter spanius]
MTTPNLTAQADVAVAPKKYELADMDLWGAALYRLREMHPELMGPGRLLGGLEAHPDGRIVATVFLDTEKVLGESQ